MEISKPQVFGENKSFGAKQGVFINCW